MAVSIKISLVAGANTLAPAYKEQCMDEDSIYKILTIAIETAIEVYEAKKQNYIKEQKKQNVQKIKYILKHYRIMKEYLPYDEQRFEVYANRFEVEDYLNQRIPVVMNQFNRALLVLKSVCDKSGRPEDMRCYNIVEDMYLSEIPNVEKKFLRGEDRVSEIAENYNINKRTVYKDIEKACDMLSILYFGIFD